MTWLLKLLAVIVLGLAPTIYFLLINRRPK